MRKEIEINEILKNFYEISGIRISIHDAEFNELYSYPTEIAPFCNTYNETNIGFTSSVISGCKKNIAIPMVVRSMTPDVILTDELATHEDITSVMYAKSSGCKVIATAHGIDEKINELKNCNISKVFDLIIVLSSNTGPGTVEKVIYGENLWHLN